MQNGVVSSKPEVDSLTHGIVEVSQIVRQILVESSPDVPDLRGRCYVASVLLVNALSMLLPQSAPIAMTGWVLPDGHDKKRGQNNHGWVLVHLDGEPYFLDVTLTQFASVLGNPIPPIVLIPYEEAKNRFHLVDPEPVQESQEYSTAFIRAVSDGSLLMAEMWRRLCQAEIGFAWDADPIVPTGEGSWGVWGARCVACGSPLPWSHSTVISGTHCQTCLEAMPGQKYDIIAGLAFQVKARNRSSALSQIEALLAEHGFRGMVKELGQTLELSKKSARARR